MEEWTKKGQLEPESSKFHISSFIYAPLYRSGAQGLSTRTEVGRRRAGVGVGAGDEGGVAPVFLPYPPPPIRSHMA